jgi:ATP-binding cassette subfamily B protein
VHAKPKDTKGTLRRVLRYMSVYRVRMVFALICLLISTGATIAGTYFLKPLINDYILPLVGTANPNLSGLVGMLTRMAAVYVIGVAASYSLNRLMVAVSVNTLNQLRNDMFVHMQKLPFAILTRIPTANS